MVISLILQRKLKFMSFVGPVLAVLSWQFCPAVLSGLFCPAVLSGLFCLGCPVLSILAGCSIQAFLVDFPGCPGFGREFRVGILPKTCERTSKRKLAEVLVEVLAEVTRRKRVC
jgi:hypothetical protein